jgi:hypothetical protein
VRRLGVTASDGKSCNGEEFVAAPSGALIGGFSSVRATLRGEDPHSSLAGGIQSILELTTNIEGNRPYLAGGIQREKPKEAPARVNYTKYEIRACTVPSHRKIGEVPGERGDRV